MKAPAAVAAAHPPASNATPGVLVRAPSSPHADGSEPPFSKENPYDGVIGDETYGDDPSERLSGLNDELFKEMGSLDPTGADAHKKASGGGAWLPILMLGFFGCFMYQQYQKSRPSRSHNSDHEEGAGLMDFCRPARSAARDAARDFGNRTSDMLDRRRDQRLAANDYGRGRHGHEEDDDGML